MISTVLLGHVLNVDAMLSRSLLEAFVVVLLSWACKAGELTFELPDNERQCFHELVEKDVNCVLEYQVSAFACTYFFTSDTETPLGDKICLSFSMRQHHCSNHDKVRRGR